MPSLLRDLVALVAPKRSLPSPSARRASANQSVSSSVGPVPTDVSCKRPPTSAREEEQARMDAFVFFTMMR
ncbi:uncharacterized protein IUM83_05928 [Phytophthora cinnamomi]|uniref:uncharacterized protein n=1 Tax=Phytophthora cinnamomi TaxID=4785 RepID=UPI00355991FC|nr:hypothetical protein IUM83_05928 [Phytophthora cinnamomi]